jgi:hypothetical protein
MDNPYKLETIIGRDVVGTPDPEQPKHRAQVFHLHSQYCPVGCSDVQYAAREKNHRKTISADHHQSGRQKACHSTTVKLTDYISNVELK